MIHEDKNYQVFYCDECGKPVYADEVWAIWNRRESMFVKMCGKCCKETGGVSRIQR